MKKYLLLICLVFIAYGVEAANFRDGLRKEARTVLNLSTNDRLFEVEFSFGSNLDRCRQTFINYFKETHDPMVELGVEVPVWTVETCVSDQDEVVYDVESVSRTGTLQVTDSSTSIRVPFFTSMRWANDLSGARGSHFSLGSWFNIPKKGIKISIH